MEVEVAATMRAVVLTGPGPVENLVLRDPTVPEVRPGWVRIAAKAFGLNRSHTDMELGRTVGKLVGLTEG
ncbi:hypothetical protein [Embleya sp. NPDC059237]|uniref:hypothetical protein n=1 Tax=Embleya sp. NPDC059237 TaxID=3346784 RepID=UPI0036C54B09